MYQIKIYIVRHVCIYCIVYISMIVSPIKYHIYIYMFFIYVFICVFIMDCLLTYLYIQYILDLVIFWNPCVFWCLHFTRYKLLL